ncbi:MAG: hypothetical protein IJC27_03905 [Lentisphaeria bacterium]|nr:hypothetical protein [Lentisphaeria bacterium]MBR2720960.1 hypothetical protein [Lentisphaeria bacterium]
MSSFEFGYAQADITPVRGIPLAGYFNPRPNKGAFDRLAVKAAVFRTGEKVAAIVSYDVCLLNPAFLREIDRKLAEKGSPLAYNTLYCATHTHTGPYTSMLFDAYPDAEYMAELECKTLHVLEQAFASLAPAELYAAETECSTLAFHRRFVMKNGRTLTNPGKLNPEIDHAEGGIDPQIILMEIRQDERPVLLIANISNHTDTIGGDIVSADWPGRMEKAIQQSVGYDLPVMTIIAPQGNINHFNVNTPDPQSGYAEACRIGKAYAAVILSSLYQLKKVDECSLDIRTSEFEAPYLQLTDEEYAEAKKTYEENKDAFMAEGRDFTSEDIARGVPFVKKFFAEMAIGCRENPIKEKRIERQIMISFGKEIAVVSLPAEPFVELGYAIREASPFPLTVLAALGMGEIGYVGLPHHYGNGGYETSPSRDLADRSVGETIIKGAVELLRK